MKGAMLKLDGGLEFQFPFDMGDVGFHRLDAETEFFRDFSSAQDLPDLTEHFQLPVRKAVQGVLFPRPLTFGHSRSDNRVVIDKENPGGNGLGMGFRQIALHSRISCERKIINLKGVRNQWFSGCRIGMEANAYSIG